MTENDIEMAAQDVLGAFGCDAPPIDPFEIAREEQILLIPGEYDGCFESRIEYQDRTSGPRFCLYYATESPPDRTAQRVRYSIAHELGHYYLPKHREYLRSRIWHNSRIDFLQDPTTEREANLFAAALLMPKKIFRDELQRRGGVCALSDLSTLARTVFETSLTATAVRYVEVDPEPCCLIISQSRYVQFCLCSASMKRLGIGFFRVNTPVPSSSVTGRVLSSMLAGSRPEALDSVDSITWFPDRPSRQMREQAKVLGPGIRALTLLTIPAPQPGTQ